ncbi:MAG: hypothetical protein KBA33_08055 [Cloacibacterium sp.]|nr:hypothetical protein [Cloacibacterium sp.]
MENIGNYNVYEGQTWLDISIHLYGRVDYCFELAVLNGFSITDNPKAGSIIIYNKDNEINKEVLRSMKDSGTIPATALSSADIDIITEAQRGIGWMQIGKTFKVSKNV